MFLEVLSVIDSKSRGRTATRNRDIKLNLLMGFSGICPSPLILLKKEYRFRKFVFDGSSALTFLGPKYSISQ